MLIVYFKRDFQLQRSTNQAAEGERETGCAVLKFPSKCPGRKKAVRRFWSVTRISSAACWSHAASAERAQTRTPDQAHVVADAAVRCRRSL